MIYRKYFIASHNCNQILSIAQVDNIMRPARNHVNGLNFIAWDLKLYTLIRVDIAFLDQAMPVNHDELRKDLDGMYDYFQENKITGLTLSTAIGMAMLWKYSDLPVRFLMMGGEKMLHFPKTDVKIINGYGPTEFCVCWSND